MRGNRTALTTCKQGYVMYKKSDSAFNKLGIRSIKPPSNILRVIADDFWTEIVAPNDLRDRALRLTFKKTFRYQTKIGVLTDIVILKLGTPVT